MDAGELLSYEAQPDGDVLLSVSSIEDRYSHPVTLTRDEVKDIAQDSEQAYQENRLVIWLAEAERVINDPPGDASAILETLEALHAAVRDKLERERLA